MSKLSQPWSFIIAPLESSYMLGRYDNKKTQMKQCCWREEEKIEKGMKYLIFVFG